jgi:hypothetical protein
MEFDEISLVTRPANQLSKVVLFKSDSQENIEMTTGSTNRTVESSNVTKAANKNLPKMEMEDEEMEDEEMEDEDEKEMDKMGGYRKMKKDDSSIELPSEVYDYIEALEAANAEMSEMMEKMASDDIAKEEDIMKSADPRIVEIVKAAQERAEAAEMIAKAERDFRLEREFIGKAAEYRNLPIEADKFGKVLKSAAEVLPTEVFDAITTVLNAANEMVGNGTMFGEVGKSVAFGLDDGPTSEISKMASRLREQNPSLSEAQAIAKAVEANPSLYDSYLRGK